MTSKFFKTHISHLLTVCMLFCSVFAPQAAASGIAGADTYFLADGFSVSNDVIYKENGNRVETFTVELSGGDVYPIVMACDTIYGGMTPAEIISYAEGLGYNVVGAVNSDYFSSVKVPLGAVIEDGIYKSSCEEENMLIISDDGASIVESPQITMTLTNNGGGEYVDEQTGDTVTKAGNTLNITHLNKQRVSSGGIYLFTEYFSDYSTRTSSDGWAIMLKITEGNMRIDSETVFEVTEIVQSGTAFPLKKGCAVITAAADAGLGEVKDMFSVGDKLSLSFSVNDGRIISSSYAAGCGDIIVNEGVSTDPSAWDRAISKSVHPRTAVGIKKDGTLVFTVADGRQNGYSSGFTLSELAEFLINKGCVTAVNMDGGGSSSMSLRLPGWVTSDVISRPSDGISRSCGAYILFVTNNKPDGVPARLFIDADGEFVLSGTTLSVNAIATDKGLMPVQLPVDVFVIPSVGAIDDSGETYTAGDGTYDEVFSIKSDSTGTEGTGTIHIISDVDSLSVFDIETGKMPDFSKLRYGDSFMLTYSAEYMGRHVITDSRGIKYSISPEIGSVDECGLVNITGLPGTVGTFSYIAGGISKDAEAYILPEMLDIEKHWAREYIDTLFNGGIVKGTTDYTFSPESFIKRGDFILMLWRAMGKPLIDVRCDFSDVAEDKYYYDALSWAESVGIARGSGGSFNPETSLTRQEAMTFLYRLIGLYEDILEAPELNVLDAFSDSSDIADFAVIPASELVRRGIIEGSDGRINPQNPIKRGEMAKIICLTLIHE